MAALADDIAYNSHDLHDGLRAELFSLEELSKMPILEDCFGRLTGNIRLWMRNGVHTKP